MSIRMKSILAKYSSYIIIVFVILFNLFLFSKINGQKNILNSIAGKIQKENKNLNAINEKIDNVKKKIEDKQQEQEDLKLKSGIFKQYFINRDNIPEIMADIQKRADETGTEIVEFMYEPLDQENLVDFIRMDFTIKIKGKYKHIKRFLYKIENLRWVLKQKDINIVRLYNPDKGEDDLNIDIKLFTFVKKGVKTVKKNN